MLSRTLKLGKSLPLARPVLPCIGRRSFAQVSNVEDIPTVSILPWFASRLQRLTCFPLQKEDDKPFKVPISEDSFETYQFDPPPYSLETTKSQLKQLYYDMTLIRLVGTSGSARYWC